MEYKILDKGFVKLVEFMGGDRAVVQSARVSHGEGLKGEEKDKKLIRYLLKHQHLTPFEHAVFKLHIKCPIFVARQWFRHRWASYNEISGRYTEYPDEYYIPEKLRGQSQKDKQSSDFISIPDQKKLIEEIEKIQEKVFEFYRKLLEKGVARELARMVLPLSLYTQFYWTVNARSLMNFINLRADYHAQWEIRQYAEAIAKIFKEKMPWTYEAFVDFCFTGKNPKIKKEEK